MSSCILCFQVIKEYEADQRDCHLSVTSCHKNFHHRYADRFDLIPLITMFRFSPSSIPQMSDIHIHSFISHLTSLKEVEVFF